MFLALSYLCVITLSTLRTRESKIKILLGTERLKNKSLLNYCNRGIRLFKCRIHNVNHTRDRIRATLQAVESSMRGICSFHTLCQLTGIYHLHFQSVHLISSSDKNQDPQFTQLTPEHMGTHGFLHSGESIMWIFLAVHFSLKI